MFGGSNSAFRPIQDNSSSKMAGNGKDVPLSSIMSGGPKSLFKRSALSGVADTMFKQIGSGAAPSASNSNEHSDSNHDNPSHSPTPIKSNGDPAPSVTIPHTASLFSSGPGAELMLPTFTSATKASDAPSKQPSIASNSSTSASSGATFVFGERMEERVIGVSGSSTKRPRETGDSNAAASKLDPTSLPQSTLSPSNSPTKRPRRADASDKSDAEDDGVGGDAESTSDNETSSSQHEPQTAQPHDASVPDSAPVESAASNSDSASTTRKEETRSLLESAAKEYQKRQAQAIVNSEEVKLVTGMREIQLQTRGELK